MVRFDDTAWKTHAFTWQERMAFLMVAAFLLYVALGAAAMLMHLLGERQASVWLLSSLSCAPLLVYCVCRLLPVDSAPEPRSTSYAPVTPQQGNLARDHWARAAGGDR